MRAKTPINLLLIVLSKRLSVFIFLPLAFLCFLAKFASLGSTELGRVFIKLIGAVLEKSWLVFFI